jgi:cob(I)alamin adenosyltransferase
MKIYTREGDDGSTSLSGGMRLSKHHIRIDAYGSVDELISWIGLLRDQKENANRRDLLLYIQEQLMRCASSLAANPDNSNSRRIVPEEESISRLEKAIDDMELELPALKSFIIPGGHQVVSYCHIARSVCRRAERKVVLLNEKEFVHKLIISFLNRLSDFLFVLSRIISLELDIKEVKWHL